MLEEELGSDSSQNMDNRIEFEKVLITKIPRKEDVGEIKLKVKLQYGETKKAIEEIFKIEYETFIPDGDKRLPYLDLTIEDKKVKLRFTNKARLEILPIKKEEKLGLLGGSFVLYNVDGSARKGLALDDDCQEKYEKEITYQTFSNFETASFEKDYLFYDPENPEVEGKVIIDLTFGDESVGELWSQNNTTNAKEWMHLVPSIVDFENRSKEYGNRLIKVMISNVLLRLMAFNFNLSEKEKDKLKENKIENIFFNKLPTKEDLEDVRPVDLDAIEINEVLRKKDLHFRWNTISSICASLNSGKNIILVGPPGCGKTKLAVEIAEHGMKNEDSVALLCTASPAWTTGDLVGRYLPSPNGQGLIFDEGFFLKAISGKKWLIVDEINRANIDSCFGELFSILSNQSVELPFKVEDKDNDDNDYKPVGVVPPTEDMKEGYEDYKVPASFRMIGTMNDADRGQLAMLSFALQRRFNTLYIDPPNYETTTKIIETHFEKNRNSILGKKNEYLIKIKNIAAKDYLVLIKDQYKLLFCGSEDKEVKGFVSENIIGVSILLDSMKFSFEGLRVLEEEKVDKDSDYRSKEAFEYYIKSWIAKSLVSILFPQLGAVSDEKIKTTLETLGTVFCNTPLINLRREEDGKLYLSNDEEFKTINDFLGFYLRKHIDELMVDEFCPIEE